MGGAITTPGTVTLSSNNNDFTGTVLLSTGALLITQNNSLGATSAGTTVTTGTQLRTANNITVAEPITLNGTGAGGTSGFDGALRTNAGSNPTFTGQITLGSSGVLLFNNAMAGSPTTATISGGITGTNTDLRFSSLNSSGNWTVNTNPISTGTGSLTKEGAGILTLAGAKIYSGSTTVSGGTLLVNNTSGSGTGSGNVTVASGATLGGTGTIAGSVSNSGTLSPGASVGTLTINGTPTPNLSLLAGDYKYELSTSSVAADLTQVAGNLNITAGVALTASDIGPALLATGIKFTLINYGGLWNGGIFNGLPNNSDQLFIGPNRFQIRYDDTVAGVNGGAFGTAGSSHWVTITTVPEASSFVAFGLCGILAIAAVRMGKRYGFALLKI